MTYPEALVVGSGFAGSILAERLASQRGLKVLLLERRDHIAGNMFDYTESSGALVHKYGPHLFRTGSNEVIDYLSEFTEWVEYKHRALVSVGEHLVPIPINLNSIEILFGELGKKVAEKLEISGMGSISILDAISSEDPEVREVGQKLFHDVYENYTKKQWGDDASRLDLREITKRVPIRIDRNDEYFRDKFQKLPKLGYTVLFENILNHKNITVELGVAAGDRITLQRGQTFFDGEQFYGPVIYTGPLDEFFGYKYGSLPYRSLNFKLEFPDSKMPAPTVNYPSAEKFTRKTDFSLIPGVDQNLGPTILTEYPAEYKIGPDAEPYYPIPGESEVLYKKYAEEAEKIENLHPIGRLAEYRYYDMSDIVSKSLSFFTEKWAN